MKIQFPENNQKEHALNTSMASERPAFDDWPIVFVIFRLVAGLSIIGSIWVVTEILRDKRKRSMCYHRLTFAISFFNLLAAIWFFIGERAQKETAVLNHERSDWAHGNATTCRMSGFSIYLGTLAIPCYNAALAIYYYLAVCCGWEEERIKKDFERYVHYLIGPVSLIIAIIPLFFDLYGVFYTYCYVVDNNLHPNFAAQDIFELLTLVTVFLSGCIMAICLILLISHRHSSRIMRIPEFERTSTGIQMIALYTASFVVSWFVPVGFIGQTILFVRTGFRFGWIPKDYNLLYVAMVYLVIAPPSQGFLNWVIYLWPRFRKCREESGSCCVIRDALFWSCSRPKTFIYDGDCYLGSCVKLNSSERKNKRFQESALRFGMEKSDGDVGDPDMMLVNVESGKESALELPMPRGVVE